MAGPLHRGACDHCGAPVWLDVPDLGEISVDEQIYITEIYPLLISEQETDRERAYIRLKEIAEAQPIQQTAPDDVTVTLAHPVAFGRTNVSEESFTC